MSTRIYELSNVELGLLDQNQCIYCESAMSEGARYRGRTTCSGACRSALYRARKAGLL